MVLVDCTRPDQSGWSRSRFTLFLILLIGLALALAYSVYRSKPQHAVALMSPVHSGTPPPPLPSPVAGSAVAPEPGKALLVPVAAVQPRDRPLPAFPGAEGDGAASRGGRGGKVLFVDRLDDPCPTTACTTAELDDPAQATPGTLRWALTRDFPRTVVFRVSGIIRLQEDRVEQVNGELNTTRLADIRIRHPYLTVAGQTAPAGGITIAGNGITIKTHDVIFRYLRFRTGRGTEPVYPGQQNPETFMLENGAERVVIDHCSFSWMSAEGVGIYTGQLWDSKGGTARDITLSWNLIAEGLIRHEDGRGHPSAAFMAGVDGDPAYAAERVTLHHNLLAHSQKRNGDLLIRQGRLINNLFYNWQWLPTVLAGAVEADLQGNVWKPGPQSSEVSAPSVGVHLVPAAQDLKQQDPLGWWFAVPGYPSLYLSGNAFGSGQRQLSDQKDLLCYYRQRGGDCRNRLMAASWFRSTALPAGTLPVTVMSAAVAEREVLAATGAAQRINHLGKWVNNRDEVDDRYVAEYRSGTYLREQFPWDEEEVGGYPLQIEGDAYPDEDQDGMSDFWEMRNGLDPADPDDGLRIDPASGYTHMELFINGMK